MAPKKTAQYLVLAASLLPATACAAAPGSSLPDQAPPLAITQLSGVTFLTADFASARRFYAEGAGFAEVPEGPGGIRFSIGEHQWIEFLKAPDAHWARRLQYVTLETNDIEGVEAALRARGVPTTWVDSNRASGILQFIDPAGNRIHVAESRSPRAPAKGRNPAFSTHLQHFGFAVAYPQAQAMLAFYRDTLGFPDGFRANAPDGRLGLAKFRLPGPSRELIELIFYDPPLNKWAAGAFDHLAFEVADIDVAYRSLHRGGIATQGNHLPTVNGEHLWAIDIIDPELTRLEIQVLAPTQTPVGTVSAVGGDSAKPLFDGRTLEGWEGNTSNWRVEDGAIIAGALDRRQPHNEFLMTKAEYGNFELRLQYKVEGKDGFVNGGVQFWSQRVPGDFEVSGYQADLGADTDGNLYDESRRGVNLAIASPELRNRALRPGDWNDYRIRAEGAHIQIWLNGVKTVDFTEKAQAIPERGRFALQIHGGAKTKVSYRNLQLETLGEPVAPGN